MTNSTTTQTQIQGFELAHSNIYPIPELLESVNDPVLCNQNCRISATQRNKRILVRSPSEDLVLIV